MRRQPHSCPQVIIDTYEMNHIEDFADYLPEGVTLLPLGTYNARVSVRHGCLCGVDMEKTAASNGYGAVEDPPGHFTFTLI